MGVKAKAEMVLGRGDILDKVGVALRDGWLWVMGGCESQGQDGAGEGQHTRQGGCEWAACLGVGDGWV